MNNEDYIKKYGMTKEEYFIENFNEVGNLTVKCKSNRCLWPVQKDYPELEIGKTYDVSYIGVFRSYTKIILREFGDKEYNAVCFEIFENGEPLNDNEYTQDPRFEAPYLRKWLKK